MPKDSNDDFEFNTKGLDALIATFKGKIPMAKIGVLGDGSMRNVGDNNNADILARHEFGGGPLGLPARSVLRVPLIENFQRYLSKSGFFEEDDEELAKKILNQKSFIEIIAKLGILGEQVIADAFKTRGFGRWYPSNMKYKKNHETLVETGQLRTSITSVVDGD